MITLHDYLEAEFEVDVRDQKRGWKIHAAVYGVVMTGLIVLNILLISLTAENFVWFPFALVGWGIGLTVHYLFGVRWAERLVREHQREIQEAAEEHTTD